MNAPPMVVNFPPRADRSWSVAMQWHQLRQLAWEPRRLYTWPSDGRGRIPRKLKKRIKAHRERIRLANERWAERGAR